MRPSLPTTQELNLPDSVRQLYHRRYSDPGDKQQHQHDSPRTRRRHSLSALDGLQDVSSVAVRSSLKQILQESGFSAQERATHAQYRKYSFHVDLNFVNLLEVPLQRRSFMEKMVIDESKGREFKGQQTLLKAGPLSHDRGVSTSHSKKRPSLWGNACRDSIAKFRNHIFDTFNNNCGEFYLDYLRKHKQDGDEDSLKMPRCKYRLRGNGMIASELASLGKVMPCDNSSKPQEKQNIMGVNMTQPGLTHPEMPPRRRSDISPTDTGLQKTSRDVQQISRLMTRPHSSLPGMGVTTKDYNAVRVDSNMTSQKNNRSPFSSDFEHSFHQHKAVAQRSLSYDDNTKYIASSESYQNLPANENPKTWSVPWKKRGGSDTSDLKFELIGGPAVHGSPGYKGRLMILTSRTVHFHDK